jgi:hypothetical protein
LIVALRTIFPLNPDGFRLFISARTPEIFH